METTTVCMEIFANTKFVNFANDVTFEYSSTSGGCSGDGNAKLVTAGLK